MEITSISLNTGSDSNFPTALFHRSILFPALQANMLFTNSFFNMTGLFGGRLFSFPFLILFNPTYENCMPVDLSFFSDNGSVSSNALNVTEMTFENSSPSNSSKEVNSPTFGLVELSSISELIMLFIRCVLPTPFLPMSTWIFVGGLLSGTTSKLKLILSELVPFITGDLYVNEYLESLAPPFARRRYCPLIDV